MVTGYCTYRDDWERPIIRMTGTACATCRSSSSARRPRASPPSAWASMAMLGDLVPPE